MIIPLLPMIKNIKRSINQFRDPETDNSLQARCNRKHKARCEARKEQELLKEISLDQLTISKFGNFCKKYEHKIKTLDEDMKKSKAVCNMIRSMSLWQEDFHCISCRISCAKDYVWFNFIELSCLHRFIGYLHLVNDGVVLILRLSYVSEERFSNVKDYTHKKLPKTNSVSTYFGSQKIIISSDRYKKMKILDRPEDLDFIAIPQFDNHEDIISIQKFANDGSKIFPTISFYANILEFMSPENALQKLQSLTLEDLTIENIYITIMKFRLTSPRFFAANIEKILAVQNLIDNIPDKKFTIKDCHMQYTDYSRVSHAIDLANIGAFIIDKKFYLTICNGDIQLLSTDKEDTISSLFDIKGNLKNNQQISQENKEKSAEKEQESVTIENLLTRNFASAIKDSVQNISLDQLTTSKFDDFLNNNKLKKKEIIKQIKESEAVRNLIKNMGFDIKAKHITMDSNRLSINTHNLYNTEGYLNFVYDGVILVVVITQFGADDRIILVEKFCNNGQKASYSIDCSMDIRDFCNPENLRCSLQALTLQDLTIENLPLTLKKFGIFSEDFLIDNVQEIPAVQNMIEKLKPMLCKTPFLFLFSKLERYTLKITDCEITNEFSCNRSDDKEIFLFCIAGKFHLTSCYEYIVIFSNSRDKRLNEENLILLDKKGNLADYKAYSKILIKMNEHKKQENIKNSDNRIEKLKNTENSSNNVKKLENTNNIVIMIDKKELENKNKELEEKLKDKEKVHEGEIIYLKTKLEKELDEKNQELEEKLKNKEKGYEREITYLKSIFKRELEEKLQNEKKMYEEQTTYLQNKFQRQIGTKDQELEDCKAQQIKKEKEYKVKNGELKQQNEELQLKIENIETGQKNQQIVLEQLNQKHKSAIQDLLQEHRKEIKELQDQFEEKERSRKEEHRKEIKELQDQFEEKERSRKEEHRKEIQQVLLELIQEKQIEFANLGQQYQLMNKGNQL